MTNENDKCSKCCHAINRRKAIELGAQALSAIGFLSASVQFLSGCGEQKGLSPGEGNASDRTGTGTSTDTDTGSFFSFANNSALSAVGGSISATLKTSGGNKNVYITRVSSESAVTVSVVCTHAQCDVNSYNASSKQYSCPCHGSIFSAEGSVIQGPATSPLPTFPTSLSESGITVTPG